MLATDLPGNLRSILSYCCPVWTPSPKDTNWSRLKLAQDLVMRIATGCLRMADVAELHQEARKLPFRQQNELISQQFALACHLPQHPSHQLCHRPTDDLPDRRRSLIVRFRPDIQQCLAEEPLTISFMSTIIIIISCIHHEAVRSVLSMKAAHQDCLKADRRPLLQPNRHCHGRQELYWHNCAPVTSESLGNTRTESTRQHATIATTVVIHLMTPNTYSTALRSRPH